MKEEVLIAMLKPDDEDGPAELSLLVVPLEPIFGDGNILGNLENEPPYIAIDPFISSSYELRIPMEPTTNTKFSLKGRGTRMTFHGTGWLGSQPLARSNGDVVETISLVLTLVHDADSNNYEYTHQHVMALMFYLRKDVLGPRPKYTLYLQASSQLIPLQPAIGADLRLWISPITSSGRFICIFSMLAESKLVYDYHAMTLDQLLGLSDVITVKELSRATCKTNLPLQGLDIHYPELGSETGAIALNRRRGGRMVAEVLFFD